MYYLPRSEKEQIQAGIDKTAKSHTFVVTVWWDAKWLTDVDYRAPSLILGTNAVPTKEQMAKFAALQGEPQAFIKVSSRSGCLVKMFNIDKVHTLRLLKGGLEESKTASRW